MFTAEEVRRAIERVEMTGTVDKLEQWRRQDRAHKRGGGRPTILKDKHVLVGALLLLGEHSPLWISELGELFWRRLDDVGRELLGIDPAINTGDEAYDKENWYWRAYYAYHRVLDVMDGWPAPRKLLNHEERQRVLTARDLNNQRLKQQRQDEFRDDLLEMTFQLQPRRLRRAWDLGISHDQTSIPAFGQRGRNARDDKTGEELPDKEDAKHSSLVGEIDADYYPTKAYMNRIRDAAETPAGRRAKSGDEGSPR